MNQPQHNNAATQDPGDCYISTFTGAHVSLIAPDPRSIHISDIAEGLATEYRFNGHSHPKYTVAQHSVFVSHQVPAEHALQALLHDATEAYIGDLPAPAKALCPDYKAMEQRLHVAIMERFDLPASLSPEVKHADLIALATEKRDLMPQSADEDWPMLHGIQPHPQGLGICLPPDEARTWFLMRYRELTQPKSYTTGGFVPTNKSPDMATNQANAVQVDINGAPQAPAASFPPYQRCTALEHVPVTYSSNTSQPPAAPDVTDSWPKLDKPAKVGAVRFRAGVSSRLVVEAAQRLHEYEVTPEKEAERIERLRSFFGAVTNQPDHEAPAAPDVAGLVGALRAADEYLSNNKLNEIGSGSILHRRMQDALAAHQKREGE